MNEIDRLSKIGTDAVMELRKNELAAGRTFMINSNNLPSKECYMEYPDGTINIETVAPNQRSFVVIRKLSVAEANAVREHNNLK